MFRPYKAIFRQHLCTDINSLHTIQWVPEAVSPGVKRPGYEADHSPLASAEVKKMWTSASTPPYAFMAWCLIS
jgi:hypothetical protein